MVSLFILLFVIGFTYGIVDFDDLYKGETKLFMKNDDVNKKGWKRLEKDEKYNINWYEIDSSMHLAFDGLGELAGARLVIPKIKENDFYKNDILFDEKTISEELYYTSTVFLTDPDLVMGENQGRKTTNTDEIVESVNVKFKNGELGRIQREACANAQPGLFVEQGCKSGYGLAFLLIKEDTPSPFFLVYNEEKKGELLGFGWLIPENDIKDSKALAEEEIKKLFPSTTKYVKGKTAVNVWLAKDASKKEKCQVKIGEFVTNRCKQNRRGGGDTNL